MTAARTTRTGRPLLTAMMAVVVSAEFAVMWLGVTTWSEYRNGGFTTGEAGPFVVAGVSAVAGAVVGLLAMIALLRGRRGLVLARWTLNLTWLRLGATLIALMILALAEGVSGVWAAGMLLAVVDVVGGFVVTGTAVRRTRDG
jgi:hypothetical protein